MSLQNRVQLGTKFGLQLKLLSPALSGLLVADTTNGNAPVSTANAGLFGVQNATLVNLLGDRRDYSDSYVRFTVTAKPLHQIVVPVVDFDPPTGTLYLQWAPEPGPVGRGDTFEVWRKTDPTGLPDLVNKGLRRCREVAEIILMDTQDIYQANAYSLPLAGLEKTLLNLPLTTANLLSSQQAACSRIAAPDGTADWNSLLSATLAVAPFPVTDSSGNLLYNFHEVQDVVNAISVTTPGVAAGEGIETNYVQLNSPALATLAAGTSGVQTVTGTIGVAGSGTIQAELSVYDQFKTLLKTVAVPTTPLTLTGGGFGSANFVGSNLWCWLTVPNVSVAGMYYAKLRVKTTTTGAGTFYVSAPQIEPNPGATPWVGGGLVRLNPRIDTSAAIRDYWVSVTGQPDRRWALLNTYSRTTENGTVEIRWGNSRMFSGRVVTLITRTPFQNLNDNVTLVNVEDDYIVAGMGVEYYLSKSDEREGGVRGDLDKQYARWLTDFNRLHRRYAPQKSERRRLLM